MIGVSEQPSSESTAPRTESHDPAVPPAYAAFMRTGWAESPLPGLARLGLLLRLFLFGENDSGEREQSTQDRHQRRYYPA